MWMRFLQMKGAICSSKNRKFVWKNCVGRNKNSWSGISHTLVLDSLLSPVRRVKTPSGWRCRTPGAVWPSCSSTGKWRWVQGKKWIQIQFFVCEPTIYWLREKANTAETQSQRRPTHVHQNYTENTGHERNVLFKGIVGICFIRFSDDRAFDHARPPWSKKAILNACNSSLLNFDGPSRT